MATFEVTAPNGSVYEITAPDGASEQQVLQYAQQQFASAEGQKEQPAPQAPQRSLGQEIGRQVGLTGRALYEGFTAPATAVLEAGRGLYNVGANLLGSESRLPSVAQAQSEMLTKAGVPVPETGLERAVQAGAQGMAGTAGLAKMAPSVPALAGDLARQIPVSGVAGLVSQPTAEVIKDYTGSDLAATVAAVGMGAMAAGASGRLLNAAGKGVDAVKRKFGYETPDNPPIYTMDEVKQRASRSYRAVENEGITVKPQSALNMVSDIRQSLADINMIKGSPEALAAERVLNQMQEIIGTQRVPFSTIDRLRQMANDLKMSKEPKEARLGSAAVDSIDNYIAKLNGNDIIAGKTGIDAAVKKITEARKDWRNASRAQVLEDALNVAEIKKEMPNASESELIRRGFVNIAANKNKMGLFNQEEQNIIKSVIKGGSLDPMLSFFAQFNPARSKLSAYGYGAATAGSLAGGSPTAGMLTAGLAGTGYTADTIQGVLRRRAAQAAANAIASGQTQGPPRNLAYRGLFTTGLVPPETGQ